MDNSILVWLGICRAKRKGYDNFVTRRYVIKTNHCGLSWQPTAAVAKQGQVSFFTFFLYLIERTRRLLNNKRDERMYVSSSREVLLMFFSRRIRFLLVCPSGHRNWASVTDRPSDDHYKGMFTNYVHKICGFFWPPITLRWHFLWYERRQF